MIKILLLKMSSSNSQEEYPIFIDEEHDKYAETPLKSIDMVFQSPHRADNLTLARIYKDLAFRTFGDGRGPITVRKFFGIG